MRSKIPPAITLAFSLFLALTVSACSDLMGNNRGRVRLVLGSDASPSLSLAGANSAASTDILADRDDDDDDDDDGDREDRPSRWFQAANVTLSSILVRNLDGVLVNLELPLPVTVDVVQLEHGKQILLPDGALPIGDYDQVVIVMTAVQGVMHDGTIVTFQPSGGGWTAVVPICPLGVIEGGTTTVGIDLMVRNAFSWGSNRFHFLPRFRATGDCDN